MRKTKSSLLTEWEKIKDADIYPSIDDFRKLYESQPNGRCFRKYTAYPWSKENFFFGTYQEFTEFQHTTTEIPFYLADKIGTKVYSITILSFFRDENNKICARCKCDCGNEVVKSYDTISKGNARTCGCRVNSITNKQSRTHKQNGEQSTNIKEPISPQLNEKRWDCEKNIGTNPHEISAKNKEQFWWRNDDGVSYQSAPYSFSRRNNGTSFPEQAIFYYVKQVFPDAINRENYLSESGNTIELDIYVPCIHLAIEYDGAYWHQDRESHDILKNTILSSERIYLIRVREIGLDELENSYGTTIFCTSTMKDNISCLCDAILGVYKAIYEYVLNIHLSISIETVQLLNDFTLSESKLIDDRPNIYAQYFTEHQKDNIATTCLIKYWDYEKNGNLLPENVSINSNILIVLTCPKGFSQHVKPSHYGLKSKNDKIECEQCLLNRCPLLYGCPGNIGFVNSPISNCDIYNTALDLCAIVPRGESFRVDSKHSVRNYNITTEEVSCTRGLMKIRQVDTSPEWQRMIKHVMSNTDTVTKKTIIKYLQSVDYHDRFQFINTLRIIGEQQSDTLIIKIKELLPNWNGYASTIEIDKSAPVLDAIKTLKVFGSKSFQYPSLQYFDEPIIMQEFCELLLKECREKQSVMQAIRDVSLTIYIEREHESFSEDFRKCLLELLNHLSQIADFPRCESCKKLLCGGEQFDGQDEHSIVDDDLQRDTSLEETSEYVSQQPTSIYVASTIPTTDKRVIDKDTKLINRDSKNNQIEKRNTTNKIKSKKRVAPQFSTTKPNKTNTKNLKKSQIITVVLITIIILAVVISLITNGMNSSQNKYVDLTKDNSVYFTLNSDDTYIMKRNEGFLIAPTLPEVILIPETYNGKPVTVISGFSTERKVTKIIGSKNLITIDKHAFADTSWNKPMQLQEVVFPKDGNLKEIKFWAFFNCPNLEKVVVPENFQTFETGVFYHCTNLKVLVIYAPEPPSGAGGLFDDGYYQYKTPESFVVYVPDEYVETYRNSGWSKYRIRPISALEE